ncbi:MAG: bifunctional DNA primase/polymerase, partial [Sciscionella sp.]
MTKNDEAVRILHPFPGMRWTEIRTAAMDLAEHGWPVLTGTYQLAEHSGWLGKPGAMGLEPVADLWTMAATTDPTVALEWWTRRPYSVLLACGNRVDALEIPATHGECALGHLRASGHLGPIAVTPFGTWLLFV